MSARIRFRPRITKKKCFFFSPARALDCWRFPKKKNSQFQEIKKTFQKKTKFISRYKKIFFQLCFTCLFFSSPSLTFFKIDLFFYFVALINFYRKMSNVFFISSLSITFTKNRFNVCFFFLNFFFLPLSLDFGIFSDLKQRN